MERRAKIVATIGPATESEEMLTKLVLAGMDVARLNFSHGTHEEHKIRINTIRKVSEELNKPITILQDLQGPKLRVGDLPKEGYLLLKGDIVALVPIDSENPQQDNQQIKFNLPLDVPNLARSVKTGNRILLDDGNLELEVLTIEGDVVIAIVILGGKLTSNKGVNLPGADLNIPGFSEKDQSDLQFGLEQGIDAVAISFVSTPDDIAKVKKAINELAPNRVPPPIIAKLERPEAIDNLEAIIDIADGVMVARGDLAVETSPASVPIIQKKIIDAAYRKAKVVITATQMLDSMINNPRPTRAEASDVANAILDGSDAVMLSGETAVGKYPIEAVAMMNSIIIEAEANFIEWGYTKNTMLEPTAVDAVAITRAAKELAQDRNVAYIAVISQSGKTARLMSKVHPTVPILAFTPEIETYHNLSLYWGVSPYRIPHATTIEDMVSFVEEAIIATTPVKPKDQIIFVSGLPIGDFRPPNFLLLHTIGDF
jgi:pyruvate kinase